MEDGLGVLDGFTGTITASSVLILVLVEDGLGETTPAFDSKAFTMVLILVLVEDGLGDKQNLLTLHKKQKS